MIGGLPFLLLIVAVIVFVYKSSKKEDEVTVDFGQTNKIINITLPGGLIGFLISSPQRSLNNRIKKENSSGWRVIQILPADSGNLFLILFRLVLLIITFFLFTTANGYYVVLERKAELKE